MACFPVIWPDLHLEIGPYLSYFRGRVLNAGAGDRDLSPYIDGDLTNQDIAGGTQNGRIDILSPLHRIPRDDGYFDAVICNAVLEHVENPNEVCEEFRRVLKPGGYLYLCVPFMQPEHLDPTDYQRYTKDGLRRLVESHGFDVLELSGVHTVYHTLGWIVHEWLTSKKTMGYLILRAVLFPLLRYMTARSRAYVDSVASSYRVMARKRK